jgi:hypothetical protein
VLIDNKIPASLLEMLISPSKGQGDGDVCVAQSFVSDILGFLFSTFVQVLYKAFGLSCGLWANNKVF